MTNLSSEDALKIISQAWGRQRGWVFFPHIDREQQRITGMRRAGFSENEGFRWPRDQQKIIEHMDAHRDMDLYWCPSIFEYPQRKVEYAMDEQCLWADLDEADPRSIDSDYTPTVAWETSPGRYQALWIVKNGDMLGASWPGNENQRLTYHVGADKSGWDTTQLLRIPGWRNHKPEYQTNGKAPEGKLLWRNRGWFDPESFSELPEVEGALRADQITDALETEITQVDRHAVISRIKLKLNQRARDLLYARAAGGDRSENLWYLIRCLADAGCTVSEIVAVARETVWNKFDGRADELKQLITEATKGIAQRNPELTETLEDERAPKPRPSRLASFLADVTAPEWLVQGIATKGSVGFIAGAPKSFKSWVALDLALSVSTGARFLDHFNIVEPGPVLYIQEEDSAVTVKARTKKIWKGKVVDRMKLEPDGSVSWHPGNEAEFDPDIDIYCMEGFIVSEGHWQEWLDETLAQGMLGADGIARPYVLVIIDTLMNVAGEVDENRSQEMTTKIYKPMKLLMRKHNTALRFVHHMGKGGDDTRRGGAKMLGGTANHAWSEDSLYLSRFRTGIKMEFESKSAPEKLYHIGNLDNFDWAPLFEPEKKDPQEVPTARKPRTPKKSPHDDQPLLDVLGQGGMWAPKDLAAELGQSYHTVYRRLQNLAATGRAEKRGSLWRLTA